MLVIDLMNMSMGNSAYERPLEYRFTWKYLSVLLTLPKEERKKIKILDVGGAESRLAKVLSLLGFDVTVIDINKDDFGKAKFIKANILEYDFKPESFDIIIAISTIEHIGLPCYGQKIQDPQGDIKTMRKIWKWLKKGGIAIITLPFGKPHHPPTFERVYSMDSLEVLLKQGDWEVISVEYGCALDENPRLFRSCYLHEALFRDAVVMLLLRKPD
ncbi:hypothetical protein DRN38_00175 [Thermococci archaeon]|nr:MAG: hypothetical protein DRN38_00175 [Thermococci archaeon]